MEVKNREGYQRGGHVYNNEHNRKFTFRIDNQLFHDVGINETEKSKRSKRGNYRSGRKKEFFFVVHTIKSQQIQTVTPHYQQEDAMMQQYHIVVVVVYPFL